MSDELTQAPRVDGEFWVFADGRRLPRLRGAEAEPAADAPEETPAAEAAPDEGTPAPDDSEYTPERGRGLHAELTKAQQQIADYNRQAFLWSRAQQGDIEAMRELNLPVDFGDEEVADLGDGEDGDPQVAALQRQQAELAQWAQAQEAQQAQAAFNRDLDSLLSEQKISVSEFERQGILNATIQRGDGFDNLKAVVDEIAKEKKAERTRWAEELKRSKTSPFVSPGGTGATQTPFRDDMSLRERIEAAQQQARALSDQG